MAIGFKSSNTSRSTSPSAQMVDQTVYMRSQVGGLDLENIEQVTDTEITCLLKTRTAGREVRVSIRVEPDEPHNIAGIRLAPAGGPSAQTAPVTRMDEAEAMVALARGTRKAHGL